MCPLMCLTASKCAASRPLPGDGPSPGPAYRRADQAPLVAIDPRALAAWPWLPYLGLERARARAQSIRHVGAPSRVRWGKTRTSHSIQTPSHGGPLSVFSRIAKLLGRRPGPPEPFRASVDADLFVYVKIPEDIGPLDRGAKYEDPLERLFSERRLGEITGGGSQLGEARPDGTTSIEFCGVDVQVTELEPSLALLREALPNLGAPDGTELHYTVRGARLLDAYAAGTWTIAVPRAMLHPGFGI